REVMREFLAMNRKIIDLVKSAAPDLSCGVDIPFWFDSLDEAGRPRFEIEFEDTVATLAVHLIRMTDSVGIMAYRNQAVGPNSMYEISKGELATSDALRGKKV